MDRCDKCGSLLKKRSGAISKHFHAHVTQLAQELGDDRSLIYWKVLLLAVRLEPPEGASEYPYTIVRRKSQHPINGKYMEIDMIAPNPTSNCTNKELMTAVDACHKFAVTECDPPIYLKEREW